MITVKIQCDCGQPFSFDVEPVNGRMPAPVRCPACGADATEAGNQAIAKAKPVPPVLPAGNQQRSIQSAVPNPPPRKRSPLVAVIIIIAVAVPVMVVVSRVTTTTVKRYLEQKRVAPQPPSSSAPVRGTPASPPQPPPRPVGSVETPAGPESEKVEILWGGTWYPGYVVKRDGARAFIHYTGWADSWNEWVTPERLRPGK